MRGTAVSEEEVGCQKNQPQTFPHVLCFELWSFCPWSRDSSTLHRGLVCLYFEHAKPQERKFPHPVTHTIDRQKQITHFMIKLLYAHVQSNFLWSMPTWSGCMLSWLLNFMRCGVVAGADDVEAAWSSWTSGVGDETGPDAEAEASPSPVTVPSIW